MRRSFKLFFRVFLALFLFGNMVVAFHAWKFTHFYDQGSFIVKKPEEKSGWDKAGDILFGIKAMKQKNTITADSGFQVITLVTKDGLKLEAWYLTIDSSVGTVCLFHGHGGTKSGVGKEAEEFRKMGYNTLLVDFRAHGNSQGNTCTIGYNEVEDVKLAYDYIKSRGEKNILLWGISMGASTITKAIHDYSLEPGKVILEMPFGTITDAAEGRLKLMGLPPQPLATMLTFWGGIENGFWAFNMKPREFVKDIRCPVLLQWGKNDPRVSRSEEDILFNNISTASKKFVVYENSGHESLCKKEPEKWRTEVSAFLQ